MEKQRAILESVIKEEIDFISYVDLEDGMVPLLPMRMRMLCRRLMGITRRSMM